MSCLNERRKRDINHIRILAKVYGKATKQDVDIINSVNKTFDFVPSKTNKKEAIETIKFRELKSKPILSDIGDTGNEPVKPKKRKSKPKPDRKPLA